MAWTYVRRISLIIPFLFLCAFSKNDYKIEKIINDGSEFKIIIPKDFCLFDSKMNDKFISEYISNKENYYYYFKCSEIDKIKSNSKFKFEEYITVTMSKESELLFMNTSDLVYSQNANNNTKFKEQLLKININDFAKKEKILNSEKQFLKENVEESIDFISDSTKVESKKINKNSFTSYNFKSKNKEISINNYSTYIKGFPFTIGYETINIKKDLNDINNFSTYIEEIQKLNTGRLNNYFTIKNQIINIRSPSVERFEDVSDLAVLNKFNSKKVFIENINNIKKPKILIAVSIFPTNFNYEKFVEYLKQKYDMSAINVSKDDNYKNIRIQTEKSIYYFYFFNIKNYNIAIYSFAYYQPKNFNEERTDKYLVKSIKNYIQTLKKANE